MAEGAEDAGCRHPHPCRLCVYLSLLLDDLHFAQDLARGDHLSAPDLPGAAPVRELRHRLHGRSPGAVWAEQPHRVCVGDRADHRHVNPCRLYAGVHRVSGKGGGLPVADGPADGRWRDVDVAPVHRSPPAQAAQHLSGADHPLFSPLLAL